MKQETNCFCQNRSSPLVISCSITLVHPFTTCCIHFLYLFTFPSKISVPPYTLYIEQVSSSRVHQLTCIWMLPGASALGKLTSLINQQLLYSDHFHSHLTLICSHFVLISSMDSTRASQSKPLWYDGGGATTTICNQVLFRRALYICHGRHWIIGCR